MGFIDYLKFMDVTYRLYAAYRLYMFIDHM